MYSFESFGLRQMIESSRTLRQLGLQSRSMEEAANEVVDFFYDSFRAVSGEPSCALVRCFKTHRFGELPAHLRDIAKTAARGSQIEESMPCLALLATRGVKPEWNGRHASAGHQAIPLATADMVTQAPMIARLVQQMGLEPRHVLETSAEQRDTIENRALDVFHVEHAPGSNFVPAQAEFVQPYGVQSVLGFGGMLPTGELFFVVMFATTPISGETAAMFRTLALCVKLVLLNHMDKPVFRA